MAKRKWSSLVGALPKLPGESPEWMDKVRAEKDAIRADLEAQDLPIGLSEVTQLYNEARKRKDEIANEEKELNIRIEALQQLILSKLEETGTDIWRSDDYTFSDKPEPYASITNKNDVVSHFIPLADIEKAIDNGNIADAKELIARATYQLAHVQIPWQTLNSLVKAEAEAGELVFDGDGEKATVTCSIPGVNVFLKRTVNRRAR